MRLTLTSEKLNLIHELDGRGERNHGVRFRENLPNQFYYAQLNSPQIPALLCCVYEKQVQLKKGLIIWVLQKKYDYFVSILMQWRS